MITILDVILGFGVLLSGLAGFLRGFVREALDIAAWTGAGFAALNGLNWVKSFSQELVPLVRWLANLAVAVIIFFIVLLTLLTLTRLLVRMFTMRTTILLDTVNYSLGFLFGLFRGVLVISLVYLVVDSFIHPANRPVWLNESRSLFLMEYGSAIIRAVVPYELARTVKATADSAIQHVQQMQEAERTYHHLLKIEQNKKLHPP